MKLIAKLFKKYLLVCNRIASYELMIYIHIYVFILFLFYSNISILTYYVYLPFGRLAGLRVDCLSTNLTQWIVSYRI